MGQINANVRLILGSILTLGAVAGTAYLQIMFHFSTYVALAICMVVASLFLWFVNARK